MTASVTVTPDPADTGELVTIAGTGFNNYQTRILLDGVVVDTGFHPTAGAFSYETQASATPRTSTVRIQYKRKSVWFDALAPVTFVVQAISTPSSPPTPDGWTNVFFDAFTSWNPSNYFVYPNTWTNNYTGRYDPTIISSDGQKLRIYIHTDSAGTPRIAAFVPKPSGGTAGVGLGGALVNLESMAYEFSIRADKMPGYKGVPLLWPASADWPTDGEIDFPESHYDAQPSGFMHRQDGTSGSDQDYVATTAGTTWQDWHKYRLEWISGTSCKFYENDVLLREVTDRVPNTPMHLVMQFETQLNFTKPAASVQGYVEIEYLLVQIPTP